MYVHLMHTYTHIHSIHVYFTSIYLNTHICIYIYSVFWEPWPGDVHPHLNREQPSCRLQRALNAQAAAATSKDDPRDLPAKVAQSRAYHSTSYMVYVYIYILCIVYTTDSIRYMQGKMHDNSKS